MRDSSGWQSNAATQIAWCREYIRRMYGNTSMDVHPGYGHPLTPCPRCGETICAECEDWQRHHSLRGRAGQWLRRYVTRRFIP